MEKAASGVGSPAGSRLVVMSNTTILPPTLAAVGAVLESRYTNGAVTPCWVVGPV